MPKITMMDRILYVVLIVAFLLGGVREYRLIIASDLVGNLFPLDILCIVAEILFSKEFQLFILVLKRQLKILMWE